MSKVLVVKIKEKGVKGHGCYEYKNSINGNDFKQLALILLDLESNDLPISKAILEFERLKDTREFPW